MEDWTEADLAKLSVKELKSLARKSNVNPNSKKAELVKALLTNIKDIAEHGGSGGPQTSRRITRSRASIWLATDEMSGHVKETKAKLKDDEGSLNSGLKDYVDDKKDKRKRIKVPDNIDACDTSKMFPLVSSIQLASKPLVEITNKDNVLHEHDKENEFQTAAATSKRSKRNKVQNKNIEDVLLSDVTEVNEVASVMNPESHLTAESNEQKECDLNNTFVVEEKRSASQDVKRGGKRIKQVENEQASEEQNLYPSKQLHEQLKINKSYNKNEKNTEYQRDLKLLLASETKTSPEKLKRGKKRKSELPVENKISLGNTASQRGSVETSDLVENTHGPSKSRRKKGNKENEIKSVNKITQDIENSPDKDLQKITFEFPETSDSRLAQNEKLSDSSETKLEDSKERKQRNNPLLENSSNNSENNFPGTFQNKSKRKKGAQPPNSVLSGTETTKGEKLKRGKNKNQELSLEGISSRTQELVEMSFNNSPSSQRSSRQRGSLPNFQNESTVINDNKNDSLKKSLTKKHNSSNGNILEDKDVSAVQGETEHKIIQLPIRSSTFILSDSGVAGEAEEMPVPVPTRNATFILTDSDGKKPHRRSLRFSPGPAIETKATSSQNADKSRKSIGNRIMQTSAKRGVEKTLKKEQGSTLKKTTVKSTPRSVCKKRSASKLPDFKKIHQQLFNNMESCFENKKRLQDRAQGLLMSPLVPRCAILSPKTTNTGSAERSPHRTAQTTKVRTPVAPSPLAVKLKTPAAPRTPMAARKPVSVASSVNRFGFRKPIKKEEATSIIGKKLPSVNLDKKKEQDRNVLKGVRVNKRFMLQMQMRQMGKGSDK